MVTEFLRYNCVIEWEKGNYEKITIRAKNNPEKSSHVTLRMSYLFNLLCRFKRQEMLRGMTVSYINSRVHNCRFRIDTTSWCIVILSNEEKTPLQVNVLDLDVVMQQLLFESKLQEKVRGIVKA